MNSTDLPLISQVAFDAFVADQVSWIKTRLKDKPGSLMPYLAIRTLDMAGKDGLTICAINAPFNEDEEKRDALTNIGVQIYAQQVLPLAVALTCEAWRATNCPKGVEPRHFAGKREVAIVFAESVGNRLVKMVSIDVRRDGQNRLAMMGREVESANVRLPILGHFFRGFFLDALNRDKT